LHGTDFRVKGLQRNDDPDSARLLLLKATKQDPIAVARSVSARMSSSLQLLSRAVAHKRVRDSFRKK
jgi:hypothetical protein